MYEADFRFQMMTHCMDMMIVVMMMLVVVVIVGGSETDYSLFFLCSLKDLLATLCEVKKMLEVHKYILKFKKIFRRQIQGQVQENAPSTNIYFDH